MVNEVFEFLCDAFVILLLMEIAALVFVSISRDILCYAMRTLSHCFIVGHVHDELIMECSRGVSVDVVCEQMSRTPPWVPGLILNAAGFEAEHYKKD